MSSKQKEVKLDPEAISENERRYATFLQDPEAVAKFPNRPVNLRKTPPFSDLCLNFFNKLLAINNKSDASTSASHSRLGINSSCVNNQELKRYLIDSYISHWRATVGPDFYPAFRLILPDKDGDRGIYNLRESAIAKLLVKLMNLDRHKSEDARKLLSWRVPGNDFRTRAAGNFPRLCYEEVVKRPMRTTPGDLTIADVNELLDKLAAASGEAENLAIFGVFYTRMCPEELLWVIRIILKQMRLGTADKIVFSCWHRDAEALFNISSSLRKICWELYDPKISLDRESTGISLGECFQPQLAQFQKTMYSWNTMVRHLHPEPDDPEFWIEEKLDGERMQMHMMPDPLVPCGKRFKWFSRRTKDYTYLYGSHLEQPDSAMTKHLKVCFHENLESVILDGEMITWDPKADLMVPFGSLKTAALDEQRKTDGDRAVSLSHQPYFRVFDLLYMNGKDLTRYTLRDRRNALHRIIRQHHRAAVDGSTEVVHGVFRRLEIHPHIVAQTAGAIEIALRDVISRASEGLVLKNPRSVYRLNSRNNDWLKVKPEYMNEFGESLDLVVIGGYFGSGHRGNMLSSFLCGLRASENHIAAGISAEKCWSFCRVGGGFSRSDYDQIKHQTDGHWHTWDDLANFPHSYIKLATSGNRLIEKPDRWIRPRDSFVIEVKAASVVPSDSFATKKTLRFPRLKRLRFDKAWNQALSFDDFDALQAEVAAQLEEKSMTAERKGRRKAKRAQKKLRIAGADMSSSGVLPEEIAGDGAGTLFEGMTFCIMSDAGKPLKMTKAALEEVVRRHGGNIVQRVTNDDIYHVTIIAEKKVVAVASALKRGSIDIVKPIWLIDCTKQSNGGSLLPKEPAHYLFAQDSTLTKAAKTLDKYDDSYARNLTDWQDLKKILNAMPTTTTMTTTTPATLQEIAQAAREMKKEFENAGINIQEDRYAGLFTDLAVSFRIVDSTDMPQSHLATLRSRLRRDYERFTGYVQFGGGTVVDDFARATHVVVVGDEVEEARGIKGDIAKVGGAVVVWGDWVEASWEKRALADVWIYAVDREM